MTKPKIQLPLIPLADMVCFPHTELSLQFDAEDREIVESLMLDEAHHGLLGVVLLKPDWADGDGRAVYRAGTAARVMDLDFLPDGGCTVRVRGEYRFTVESETEAHGYREALVSRESDVTLDGADPDLADMREQILDTTRVLAERLADGFVLDAEELDDLDHEPSFETVVNRLSADLDLAPWRKLELLLDTLPQRAVRLLGILRSRERILELLVPYRHLAGNHELN